VCAVFATSPVVVSAEQRPNVIVIVADDLGYADMSFLPQSPKDVKTPGIDRLADSGTYFTDAYATSPICSPSRAGLITGRYQQRWGNYWYGQGGLPKSEVTIAHALKELGYFTKKIGKTHLNGGPAQHPLDHGFDEFLGFITHTWDYVRLSQSDLDAYRARANGKKLGMLYVGPLTRGRDEKVSYEDGFTTQIFTDEAVRTIREGAKSDKPFFIELEYNAVHMPTYVTHPAYAKRVGLEQKKWDRAAEEWDFPYWDPRKMSWGEWHKSWGHLGKVDPLGRKCYLSHLMAMDDGIAEILNSIEETGQRENTIVMFLSDNGGTINTYSNNAPLRGYKYMFGEGGIRIPLIVSWPGHLPTGKRNSSLVSAIDIFPTILEFAGNDDVPADLDGRSLVKTITAEQSVDVHDHLCWAKSKRDDTWVIRSGKWKLIHSKGWTHSNYVLDEEGLASAAPDYEYPEGTLLFDLTNDIGETTNVAAEHPQVVREMTLAYEQWKARMIESQQQQKRSEEELYDLRKDPDQLRNVADDPATAG
jgi:arylsulfatase A-like enzyme